MSSADEDTKTDEEVPEEPIVDEQREDLLERVTGALGDGVVASHIRPTDDLWIRVSREAWSEAGALFHDRLGFRYFDFLSAIDWLPSPYGREMDAEVDTLADEAADSEPEPMTWGVTGGETRFQILARVHSTTAHIGVTLKADVPDDDLVMPTWIPHYAGADWHEREVHEMYGIDFAGHPDLRNLYLPSGFEGFPLRKDYPLLSRRMKPWPGIVDVETMPGEDEGDETEGDDA